MNNGLEQLLRLLGDGQRFGGAELAQRLGVSRAAVWKRIETLRGLGLGVDASSAGYCLPRPIEWLDQTRITAGLLHPIELEIDFLVTSTNASLAEHLDASHPPRVLLAEGQSAGRGRRGRSWQSPPGGGVYLSLAWHFESGLTGLSALSLVAGMAAVSALRSLGVEGIRLKWPNDLLVDDRKIGGCLVEVHGSAEGPCGAIIGLGINFDLGPHTRIDQPWTDLVRLGHNPGRNALAAALINELVEHAQRLDRHGFSDLLPRWPELDALAGRNILVHQADGSQVSGRADGIDAQGRLRLAREKGTLAISSGEVSVRAR